MMNGQPCEQTIFEAVTCGDNEWLGGIRCAACDQNVIVLRVWL